MPLSTTSATPVVLLSVSPICFFTPDGYVRVPMHRHSQYTLYTQKRNVYSGNMNLWDGWNRARYGRGRGFGRFTRPPVGWGVFLTFHFLSVFVFRGGMTERMVQREGRKRHGVGSRKESTDWEGSGLRSIMQAVDPAL
jgi:hypothetical protein